MRVAPGHEIAPPWGMEPATGSSLFSADYCSTLALERFVSSVGLRRVRGGVAMLRVTQQRLWEGRPMRKHQMRDLIILIPGITGSVLSKGKDKVWATIPVAATALKPFGDGLEALRVPRHKAAEGPPEIGPESQRIRATALFEDFHGVFGLGKIDGYTKTARAAMRDLNKASRAVGRGDIFTEDEVRAIAIAGSAEEIKRRVNRPVSWPATDSHARAKRAHQDQLIARLSCALSVRRTRTVEG